MNINYHIPNDKVDLFLEEAIDVIPEIEVEIVKEGDFWSTVGLNSETPEDSINISIFAEVFSKLYINK